MEKHTNKIVLLQTKLYRPNIPIDHMHRHEMVAHIESNRQLPLVLFSAPAGYGKSTLASCWLDNCDRPNAWLSLDERDNDLRKFVFYFVSAVQTIFPEAAHKTMTYLNESNLPPMSVLTATLINELESINQEFVIALDDIHCITDKNIMEFLSNLIRHPQGHMQLVIIGRRDPILPVSLMRARGQLLEIRLNDLRFSSSDSLRFLQTQMKLDVENEFAEKLTEKTEGWITGLRLAVLALNGQVDAEQKIQELKGNTHYILDYLMNEVLLNIPEDIRQLLLKTSILKRFCEPVCDKLLETDASAKGITGYKFIRWVLKKNMFIIPLDMENKWLRFHHLFGDLLKRQFLQTSSKTEVNETYQKASVWFEEQDLIDESIHYALSAGNPAVAADIIQRHRYAALNEDKWFVLQNWLMLLPETIIEESPELLLTKAWVLNHQFRLIEIPEILKRIDSILKGKSKNPALLGELNFFKAFILFWEGQIEYSEEMSKKAQGQIPTDERYDLIRGDNEIYFAMALQMRGKGDVAIGKLKEKMSRHTMRKGMYFTRLTSSPCFVHLLSGDLKQAKNEAFQLKTVSKKSGLAYADSWSDYMQACCYFHVYDLDNAHHHFAEVSERKYVIHASQSVNSQAGLAMTCQAMGLTEEAESTMDQLTAFAIAMNDSNLSVIAQSARVRLSLIQGHLEPGIEMVRTFDEPLQVSSFFVWLEIPHVTLCRVLIAIGSNDSLTEASKRLELLLEIADSIHNTFHKIDILVLKSIALYKLSRIRSSLEMLEKAIQLSIPGGWVRPFVEAGTPIIDILKKLHQQNTDVGFIEELFDAFKINKPLKVTKLYQVEIKKSSLSSAGDFKQNIDPLTNRELDVLELLCERLQNKEIAEKLFISTTTVKSHLKNIFQKLQVEKRRQAVEKAIELEIIKRY